MRTATDWGPDGVSLGLIVGCVVTVAVAGRGGQDQDADQDTPSQRHPTPSRDETLAGIRALWEDYSRDLPAAAAATIGAIYARYSTKGQSSVLDQVRTCLEFAAREGIHVPLEHIHFDLAVSGRKARRPGYAALEACLDDKRVRALLVFTTNRLHRRASRALQFVERLVTERGVRVAFVMSRIDSKDNDQWKKYLMFLLLHDEFAAEMYVENIHAAHVGKLLSRLVFGTVTFGYRGVEVPGVVSRKGTPGRRVEVDAAEAAIVLRVFTAFVRESLSINALLRLLNADPSVPPPRKGNSAQWTRLAMLTLLRNERYRGWWSYGSKKSVLMSEKDYVRQFDREKPLRRVEFPELRVVPDDLYFAAQRRLAELRPERGRTPSAETAPRLPRLLNGLFVCPAHERALTVGGSHGQYLTCPACIRESGERRALVSQLHRVTAVRRVCEALAAAIAADAGLVAQVNDQFRRAAAELQSPDPAVRESLAERKRRLTRLLGLLVRQEPASEAEEREIESALREKRRDLAGVEADLARLAAAAGKEVRVPTEDEVRGELARLSETLLRIAVAGPSVEADAARELLARLTGGRIVLAQCGEPTAKRGWLEGRFTAPLAVAVGRALGLDPPAGDAGAEEIGGREAGAEIVVSFRADPADAGRLARAWALYEAGTPHKRIAAELDCSRANVTRLLNKAAAARGLTLEDGRRRRGQLPKDYADGEEPIFVAIGDRAVELWKGGASCREIGRVCGCTDTTAEKALRRWHESRGLPAPTPESRRAERLTLAQTLHAEGLGWGEVASRLGVTTTTLRTWRNAPAT